MTSTLKTITNLSTYSQYWVSMPGSNMIYAIFQNDRTKLYYFDATTSSPITASSYSLSGLADAQDLCYGYYASTHTIFLLSYNSYIYQISLNSSGTPISDIQLANSNSKNLKTSITFGNNLLYIIRNISSSELSYYDLSINTYTNMTISGSSFTNVQTILFYSNNLYLSNFNTDIYKGTISGSSVVYSVYLSGYVAASIFSISSSDTVYLTDYGTGGTSSVLYKITNFLTSPISTAVSISPGSSVNGIYPIALSSDYSNAYINNSDATTADQLLIVPLGSSPTPVPCLTGECEVLTTDGYVRIDQLHKDQMIVTPDNKTVPIKQIFSSEIIATKENAPYRIPKDFFHPGIPTKDIRISPHHLYFYDCKWTLPVWTDGIYQEKECIGKTIRYYHVRLEDYPTEKLMCHGLPVDSWEGEKEMTY